MTRTARAALVGGLITMLLVASVGTLMGFPATSSLMAGLVVGALAAALIGGVAVRSGSTREPTPPKPRHPGPPEHREDDQT